MEYIIIETDGIEECIKLVNTHLGAGWVPVGGICVIDLGGKEISYAQALIREDKDVLKG
jgi:hypothetical protein